MSQIINGVLAAVAVSATFGAVQFASGHDLTGLRQLASTAQSDGVNRAAKADRAAVKAGPAGQANTMMFRLDRLAATSVLVRVPVAKDQARNRLEPATKKPETKKPTVACEPPVSVLTDVAKLLQPGRCVT